MTPKDARFMLRQRGYAEGQDWLAHCVRRGQAGNDVGLELALVMLAERDPPVMLPGDCWPEDMGNMQPGAIIRRGPGRPRKVA
jgi:hypothetical protein